MDDTKIICLVKALGEVARIALALSAVGRAFRVWRRRAKLRGKREEP
ncbi:hypothetical protein Q4610_18770 [Sphingobium sp. HBC34]|uniref:Uncharacterized protein n=1 Tax=Sphingobium cyanobacteriorum TaxID=3063954 RepID=A0ABT8ZRC9_9SPHN|nr:hypothetical protein [Sphingobium sp. HBC34]MDO7837091.1 hypothetical protein [Sphingobium sp. HBC34]